MRRRLLGIAILGLLVGCAPASRHDGNDPARPLPRPSSPPDWTLSDLQGRNWSLEPTTGVHATVAVFLRTDCPISNRYAPEIRRLADEFTPLGVRFCMIYPEVDESNEHVSQHVREYALPGTILRDVDHGFVAYTGATVMPEAVVLDADLQMTYRGRIDDRFISFGQERSSPTQQDLTDAIVATLSGESVETSTTQAVGCYITPLE